MGSQNFTQRLNEELEAIRSAGLYKEERVITGPQEATIPVGALRFSTFVRTTTSASPMRPSCLPVRKRVWTDSVLA